MIKRTLIYLFLFTGSIPSVLSQIQNVNIGGSFSGTFVLSGGANAEYPIAGSPYLSETWMFGTLIIKDDIKTQSETKLPTELKGLFRYNLYAQEFEMVHNSDTLAITAPFNIKTISISNMDFIHGLFVEKNNRKERLGSAYFQVLSKGNCKLLMRHGVMIKGGSAPVTYGWASGADAFVQYQHLYYQENEGSEVIILKNRRKSMKQLFAARYQEIDQYIKSEKINIQNTSELAKVFNYYNTLDK